MMASVFKIVAPSTSVTLLVSAVVVEVLVLSASPASKDSLLTTS